MSREYKPRVQAEGVKDERPLHEKLGVEKPEKWPIVAPHETMDSATFRKHLAARHSELFPSPFYATKEVRLLHRMLHVHSIQTHGHRKVEE